MPKDEPANIYVLYQSKIKQSNQCKNTGLKYFDQISRYLSSDRAVKLLAEEITSYAKNKEEWNQNIAMHKYPMMHLLIVFVSTFVCRIE